MIIPASSVPANETSVRCRSSLPRWGRVRKRTGPVPGRRPTNSPPFSVGSLRICFYVRSYASAGTLARVQRVEKRGIPFVDNVALDLQSRRQLAGRLGEVVVEDQELLDLLDLSVFGVDEVDLMLDERVDGGGARERGDVLGQIVLACIARDLFLVQRDQHHRVGA